MFLAGSSQATATGNPNPAQLRRAEAEHRYWFHGLHWFIRCDECGHVSPYHWDPATDRGWKPYTGPTGRKATGADPVQHVCATGCTGHDEQLTLEVV